MTMVYYMSEKGKYGSDKVKGLGTVEMGIPSHDREPYKEAKPPLKNKWSPLYDTSASEAKRMVGGKSDKK